MAGGWRDGSWRQNAIETSTVITNVVVAVAVGRLDAWFGFGLFDFRVQILLVGTRPSAGSVLGPLAALRC